MFYVIIGHYYMKIKKNCLSNKIGFQKDRSCVNDSYILRTKYTCTLSLTHTTLRHSWKCREKIPRFSHLHFRSGVIYDLWPFWSSFQGRGGASPQISLGPKPCFTSLSLSLWGLLPGTPGPWERAPGGRRGGFRDASLWMGKCTLTIQLWLGRWPSLFRIHFPTQLSYQQPVDLLSQRFRRPQR